jgi:hypothetical protein
LVLKEVCDDEAADVSLPWVNSVHLAGSDAKGVSTRESEGAIGFVFSRLSVPKGLETVMLNAIMLNAIRRELKLKL